MDKYIIKEDIYDKFKCSGSTCPITCCMQWKIAVDDKTMKLWEKMGLDKNVTYKDEDRVIKLNKNGYCPHFDGDGLCKIVKQYGDKVLSHTCDIFPRQISEFENVIEKTLVTCCPEVINLINEEKEVGIIYNNDALKLDLINEDIDFNCNVRNLLVSIINNDNYSLSMNILMAFYVLLDIYHQYEENLMEQWNNYDKNKWLKDNLMTYRDLEPLAVAISELDLDSEDTINECNEIWLDIVCNYREQGLYLDYIEEISKLAEMAENNRCRDIKSRINNSIATEKLLRKYMTLELLSNMVTPESDMYDLVMMYEWISIEFVTIRHGILLCNTLKQELTYEDVRNVIVIVSRMTGYDEADVYEYLDNSFENVIWDFGYMHLIIGKDN